jgi:hypothetical protein
MSRILTLQYLQTRTLSELLTLRGALHCELCLCAPYSTEALCARASLDMVNRMIRMRSPAGPRP